MIAAIALTGISTLSADAKEDPRSSIEKTLTGQTEAWNSGNLEKFMTYYLDSPETSYTSAGKELWGYKAIEKHYLDRYGDNQATMGKLETSKLRTVLLGKDSALCVGNWHLVREKQPVIEGVFSLVLSRVNAKWKIIHDHTSVRP